MSPEMGLSYILMLTAFYVDNGKKLPVWRDLPYRVSVLAPGQEAVPRSKAFNSGSPYDKAGS